MDEQNGSSLYTVGGHDYRLEPLSWQQNKWLADHVFQDIDLQRLDYATIWDLFREKGPLIMAISLIANGMSRTTHSKQAFTTISSQAERFAAELTGGEVAQFAPHFFQCCRPDQLVMLMPGKSLVEAARKKQAEEAAQAEAEKSSAAPGATTSSGVSSPSAEATLPSSPSSSVNGDHASPSPISVAASNGSTLITPSSASAG